MKFPVDLLADVSQADLERSAQNYMNSLLFSDPDSLEHLTLSDSTQVTIGVSTVGFIPLYGFSDKHKLLALFTPSDHLTAVALYLLDQWWAVNDILKTADPARNGAMEVETVGERIVLYMLNRVIYRAKEMSTEELPFLCHEEKDYAKILWNNGEAVGFYSVKPTGSLYKSYSMRSYQLPVMDSIFVRKCQRGKGFGLKMLEDFVLSFKEDSLGLRYPLTKSMYKVCKKYLCQYPEDTDLLWEVEGIGWPNQRTNIASKVQAMDLSTVSKSLSFTEESLMTTEVTERDVEGETVAIETKEVKSMEFTVEIVEEVTIVRSTRVSGEGEVPVVVRDRSSGSKRRHSADKTTEDKPEKVIRIEDIEAETPEEKRKTELQNASELEQAEGVFSMTAEEKENGVVDTAAEEESMMVDKLDSEDATAAPMTEKPQESDAPQDLTTTSNDSDVIVVENVASEIEDPEKNTGLTVSEDLSEEHKEGETVDEVIDGHEIEASNEKLEASQPENQEEITYTKGDVTVEDLPEEEKPQYKDDLPREEEGTEKDEEPGLENSEVKKNSTDLPVTTEPALTKESEEKVTFEPEKVQKDDDVEISVIQDEQEVSDEETEEPPVVHRRALRARRSAKSKPKKQRKRDQTEKEEHTDEADVDAGGSAEEKVDVRAADKEKEEQHQVEEEVTVDKAMEISTEETMVVTEDPLPQAEDTADDVTPTPEMNAEWSKEAHEEEEAETMEADKDKQAILVTEEVDNTTQEPNIVPAAIDTVKSDEVQDEPVVPTAETLQEKDIACKIPRLSKATVILVDIKTACPHLGINDAEETTADGECATLGHEEMELMTAEEEKEVAEEQTLKPEMLTTEPGEDEMTQKNTPEKCVDATAEVEAVKKDEFEEDNSEKETGEIPVIEARVLRSGRKTVEARCKTRGTSNQQQEEDNTGEGITENKMDEPEAGTVENEMEVVTKDAVTVMSSQEENESAFPEECAGDGAEGNLPPSEVNETMSVEVEEPSVVETRALRRGPKTITATPTQRIPRSRKQVEEQEAENSEEEVAVTTRTLRRGRVSALATPKGRSKTSKQIREDKKEEEESASVKDIAVEKTNEEIEEKNEEIGEKIQEEAASEKVEGLEIEIDAQEGKAEADGQNVMEEQSDREAENFGEEHNDSVTAGAGATAAADDLVEEKDTDPPLAECNTDPAAPAPGEEEATPSTEEHGEKTASEVSDLQRVTVVLVDLKHASSAILDETAAVVEDGATEKTDVEAEEEHEEEAMTEEEKVAKEDVAASSEMENVVEEGDGLEEKVEDVVTPQEDTGEGSVEETEATAVDETDEEEPAVADTRSLRSRKQAAKATPRRKSARGRQKRGGEEKEEATEVSEEEAEGEEGSAGDEKKEAEEKEEHNQEQQQIIDQEKEERLGENETGMVEQRADISADEAVAQQDVPEEGQVGNTETTEAPAADVAEEAAESQDIVEKEQVSTSDEKQTAAGESEQETPLTALDEKANNVSEEEEEASVSTRILRSGKKAVRAKSRRKTTKTQACEEDVEVAGEKSTEEDEPEVETRVLRKGRRSAAATPRYKSKRVHTQKPEEEAEEVSTPAEDTEADEKENSDEKKEDGEGVAQKDGNTEPELETGAEESLTEQETAGEDQCAASQTSTDGLTEASAGETPNTDEGKVTDEEEAPVFEARILRSGKKAVKATARSETPKNQEEENVEDGSVGKKSSEARVLRRGRRSAPATPQHKSKRARTQHLPEEEEAEVTSPAEDTEEEEEQAGDKSPEKKEEAEGQMEVETNKDLEEENVETAAGGESVVGDAEQMMDATTKEATVLDEEDSVAADDTGLDTVQIPSAEAEGTNSAEEEETAVAEESDTATAEEEAQVDDTNVAGQEEAPAGATRTLRSQTKTSHAMPSKRQKNQEEMEAQQQEDEETQEDLHSLTEDSAENKEPSVQEPAETEKTSQAEDTVESQAEDEADVIDNRETPAGQPATEERQSSDQDSSGESAETTTATKGRNLRKGRRKKTAKTHVLKRRSRRKRPRVDYSENNDEDDREETETATDKEEEDNTESDEDKDNKKDECSSEQTDKQEENSKEENREKYGGAVQNTSENSATLNLVLDTDEEAETVASSQEHEEDEQSLSEEEDETIVIDKKVLRGRLVPSITITPLAKHRRRSAKALTAGGEKSPQSARKRSPRKRQSSEVTPAYKSRRRSRI